MTNLHRHAPLRVALVGLGTVGGGVIRLLNTNGALKRFNIAPFSTYNLTF